MNRILDKLGIPYKRNNKDIILEDFNIRPVSAVEKISYISITKDTVPGDVVYCIEDNKFYMYNIDTKQYEPLEYI